MRRRSSSVHQLANRVDARVEPLAKNVDDLSRNMHESLAKIGG